MRWRTVLLQMIGILITGTATPNPLLIAQYRDDARQNVLDDAADVVSWNSLVPFQEQRQKITLGRGNTVGGVLLEAGKYLVIHRKFAESSTEKEATYFYRMPYRPGQEAVAQLRCAPIDAPEVRRFILRSAAQPDGTSVVHSVQFPGSTEIHTFERGEVYLGRGYSVGGVLLNPGKYLVLHKSDKGTAGDPCIYFFRLPYRPGQRPAAKVHCIPKQAKPMPEGVTIRSVTQPDGTNRVRSIQFTGSTEVHSFETSG